MFRKILIANRGEIALRVMRCCRSMRVDTVQCYSEADRDSLPVEMGAESVCIGPASPAESYLNINNLIEAAKGTGCDAIHPGYGFLSENADFARACEENGITFIGPSADIMEHMGNKQAARKLMKENGVPIVPGSEGLVDSPEEAERIADEIGYPVLIKASAGGGGRGMRRAFSKEEIRSAYTTARAESEAAFGDGSMYIEKLILNPHHIEVQILGDKSGHIVQLGERDCSLQRRNQKMMEESPAEILTEEQRTQIHAAAIKAAKAAGYYSAGTVEFVLDQQGHFYFIEMNTRVQVEHPVSELVTGIDIIREQIRIAAGLDLSFKQEDIIFNGHAIECRINAEDPHRDFAPCPGKINFVHFPAGMGVRVDTAVYSGYTISPFYDSMIAKVIVYAPTRLEAIRKMRVAIEELIIDGITTNLDFLDLILYHPDYLRSHFDTSFIEKNMNTLISVDEEADRS